MENKKLVFLIDKNGISLLLPQKKDFVFSEHEVVNGAICNLTKVANVICYYLKQESLLHFSAQVLLSQNLLQEFLVAEDDLQSDLLNYAQIKLSLAQDKYYVAKVHPSILLQYQVLFFKMGVYLEEITGHSFVQAKKKLQNNKNAFMDVQSIEGFQELIY